VTGAVAAALARLEAMLDASIAAMAARQGIDDRALAEKKGRVLLELSRMAPRLAAVDAETAATITRVRGKLATEGELLGQRLAAAETIADVVAGAVRLDEWDGTYSGPAGRGPGVWA
jgi:hypothetical protein